MANIFSLSSTSVPPPVEQMEQLLFLSLFLSFLSTCFSLANSSYNAIFSFGDSYSDVGNLAKLVQNSPGSPNTSIPLLMNSPPYGMTFFDHPTGRCSDGRLVIDFIAEEFGLPLLPPYLAHGDNYHQGVNFAVARSTALDPEFYRQNNFTNMHPINGSLSVQLGWFEELKPSLCNTPKDCRDYFGQSLFFLGEIGGNDHNHLLLSGTSVEEVESLVPRIIESISMAAERLINEGAITLVIPGIMPTGCVPVILAFFQSENKEDYEPGTGCLKRFNVLSSYHDELLRNAVVDLRVKYPHARIIFAEYQTAVTDFLNSPAKFGFIGEALTVCCGAGGPPYNYHASARCGRPGYSVCSDPSTYVNWDGVHLTEAVFQRVANGWLKGPYADPPILSAPSYGFSHRVAAKR